MNILILEDEKLAADKLEAMLLELEPGAKIVGRHQSVEAGLGWLRENPHPQLILTDIRLLDGLCFEIFSKIQVECPVVFTTAYDQYAIRAFEVNSADYLLKPVVKEKLKRSLDKVRRQAGQRQPAMVNYAELLHMINGGTTYKSRFMVRLGQKIIAIPVEKIAYFLSENKLTYIVTRDEKRYPLDTPLDELIDVLDPKVFFRANRQYILTFEAIAEIHPYFKGRIKLALQPRTSDEVIVSAERTPDFKKWIDQ